MTEFRRFLQPLASNGAETPQNGQDTVETSSSVHGGTVALPTAANSSSSASLPAIFMPGAPSPKVDSKPLVLSTSAGCHQQSFAVLNPDGVPSKNHTAWRRRHSMAEHTGAQSSSSDDDSLGTSIEPHAVHRKHQRQHRRSSVSRSSDNGQPVVLLREKKTKKTDEQVAILKEYFRRDSKPPKSVHYMISRESGLTVEEVVNWFRNRRCRTKDRRRYSLELQQQHQAMHNMSPSSVASPQWPQPSSLQGAYSQSPQFLFPNPSHRPATTSPASASDNSSDTALSQPCHTGLAAEAEHVLQMNTGAELKTYPSFSPLDVLCQFQEMQRMAGHAESHVGGSGIFPLNNATSHSPFMPQNTGLHSTFTSSLPGHQESRAMAPLLGMDDSTARLTRRNIVDIPTSFMALFTQFDDNSPERKRMVAALIEKMSADERTVASQKLSQAMPVTEGQASKPLRDRVRVAWREVKRIFTVRSSSASRNREKKFSSGSNDSGCHSASGNLIRGAISDSSSGNEELDGSGNTNACAGCNLAAMARRARKPYDPDVVAGLVAMLKAHSQYILPLYTELQSLISQHPGILQAHPANPGATQSGIPGFPNPELFAGINISDQEVFPTMEPTVPLHSFDFDAAMLSLQQPHQ